MKFTVPDGYSVVYQGQVIYSKAGIIATDDKSLIESLSRNPKAKEVKSAPAQGKHDKASKKED